MNSENIQELSQPALAVLLVFLVVSPGLVAIPVMDADDDGLRNTHEWTADVDWQEADTDSDGLKDGREFAPVEFDATTPDTDSDGLNDSAEARIGTNASRVDTDQDGVNDSVETDVGTDPIEGDTDGDSLFDSTELKGNTSAVMADTDQDGLDDAKEHEIGSDPTRRDTDSDLLPDKREWKLNTSLTSWDTDNDSLSDLREAESARLNPRLSDTDADGLNDSRELGMKTLVNVSDTDADGLADGAEVLRYGSDPLTNDTDNDHVNDSTEVHHDVLNVTNPDVDGDRLSDGVEWYGKTNVTLADTDDDGLGDWNETKTLPTDPVDNDTDSDGLLDGNETLQYATEPLNPDTDGDNLTDGSEKRVYGTNPTKTDTDGDGIPDPTEVNVQGYNPKTPDTLQGKSANLEVTNSQTDSLGSFIDTLVRVAQSVAKDDPNAGLLEEYSQTITELPDADFTGRKATFLAKFKQAGLYQILDIVQENYGIGVSPIALKGRLQQAIDVGARMSAVLAVIADYATLHDQAEKLVNAPNETVTEAAQIGVVIATTVLIIDTYLLYQTGGTFSLTPGHKLAFAGTGKIAAKTKLARLAKYCSWKCVGGVERLLHWSLRSLIDIGETKFIAAIIQLGYYDITGVSVTNLLEGIPTDQLSKLVGQLKGFLTTEVWIAFQKAVQERFNREPGDWLARSQPRPVMTWSLNQHSR